MSLNFDLTRIPDYLNVCHERRDDPPPGSRTTRDGPDGSTIVTLDPLGPWREDEDKPGTWTRMSAVTHVLIWRCMAAGLHGITEKNLADFIFRCRVLNMLDGADLVWTDEERSTLYEHTNHRAPHVETLERLLHEGYTVELDGKRMDVRADADAQDGLAGKDADAVVAAICECSLDLSMVKSTPRSRNITVEEITAHIGLTTNVGGEPRGKWLNRMAKHEVAQIQGRLDRAAKASAA
jgi:hypothetical protein